MAVRRLRFNLYDDVEPLTGTQLANFTSSGRKAAGPKRKTFIFVNNRLEGNAIPTIAAMLEPG